jgi:hypothetical protein
MALGWGLIVFVLIAGGQADTGGWAIDTLRRTYYIPTWVVAVFVLACVGLIFKGGKRGH